MMSDIDPVLARFIAEPTVFHRNAVIESYHYLCSRGARKFLRPTSDRADLEQVAAIGLIKACDYFKVERGTPFEAYAWMMIVGELMHYVRDHERIVRLPRWLRSLEKRYLRASEDLTHRFGREPAAFEIAEALEVDVSIIEELVNLRRGEHVISIDSDPFAAPVMLDARMQPSQRLLSIEEKLALLVAIDQLDDREKLLVMGIFAAGYSQAEMGRRIGLSQSQISKLLAKALAKIARDLD